MKETDGWVKIKKYTDDEGTPICFQCSIAIGCALNCDHSIGDKKDNDLRLIPGPICPVWNGESKSKWQPISTAPKDGTHIQLFRKEIQFVGYYGGAESGWHINTPGLPSMWPLPTHWMPLPAPPLQEE